MIILLISITYTSVLSKFQGRISKWTCATVNFVPAWPSLKSLMISGLHCGTTLRVAWYDCPNLAVNHVECRHTLIPSPPHIVPFVRPTRHPIWFLSRDWLPIPSYVDERPRCTTDAAFINVRPPITIRLPPASLLVSCRWFLVYINWFLLSSTIRKKNRHQIVLYMLNWSKTCVMPKPVPRLKRKQNWFNTSNRISAQSVYVKLKKNSSIVNKHWNQRLRITT